MSFRESCCITEARSSDVPLKSQWKVLTWLVRAALDMCLTYLPGSSEAVKNHVLSELVSAFSHPMDSLSMLIGKVWPLYSFLCVTFKSSSSKLNLLIESWILTFQNLLFHYSLCYWYKSIYWSPTYLEITYLKDT